VTTLAEANHVFQHVSLLWIIERPGRFEVMDIGFLTEFLSSSSTPLATVIVAAKCPASHRAIFHTSDSP
jgi:hypothetical protein